MKISRLLRFSVEEQPVARGATEVEAAFRSHLAEIGWLDSDGGLYPNDQLALTRLGETPSGVLWSAGLIDSVDGWPWLEVFILEDSDGSEAFVAINRHIGDVAMRDDVTVSAEVVEQLGFDSKLWRATLLKALTPEDEEELPQRGYAVIKEDAAQRFTLGVAYPADEIDSHGDWTDATELEKAAWEFMRSGQALTGGSGTDHAEGTDMAGTPVESYIWRGPEWVVDGETIAKDGDWMLGVVWEPAAWERIAKGELTGYSIQGSAKVEEEPEAAA